ncbi:rhodanese-like domain-containing protein [Polaribacter gangjinensis]|uniref:Sulfurtransferase n=1 Tax=Polaribacter gangjinensis TaxID=574710 RepID=A0A2S7WF12_9FLAO|nr:rhodanese-like domain-containing protein [Polaribacter gangjinensis]PQJ76195.1 sulfurtransferase [Polaribacter gangjinensis]
MSAQIKEYLEKNAVILDVRTQEEWNDGHIDGAKHIVLNLVPVKMDEIKSWKKPVIAVCRSGARSGQATQFLQQHGIDIINGGPWQNVDQYIGK